MPVSVTIRAAIRSPRSIPLILLEVVEPPHLPSVDIFESGGRVEHLASDLSIAVIRRVEIRSDAYGAVNDVGVFDGATLLVLRLRCEDPRLVVQSPAWEIVKVAVRVDWRD